MRDWRQEIEFIKLRSARAGTPKFTRELAQGKMIALCPEIAVHREAFEGFTWWDREAIRAFAVGLGARKAVVVGKSAARLHGLPVLGRNAPVELCLPGTPRAPQRAQWPRGVVYRYTQLWDEHIVEEAGVRVTRLIRTAADLARFEGIADGILAFDAILRMDQMTKPAARQYLDGLGRMKFGARAIRALELADAKAESPAESWARAQILLASLPEVTSVEVQPQLLGGRYRGDLLVNGRLVVETDGEQKYDGVTTGVEPREQMRKDRERDRALTNAGIPRLHVTWADLASREGEHSRFIGMLRRALT
ncbi:hypothetical protein HCH15_04515 [Corynebacterium testudinoris]|uniref:DUF559 domain-containing protein n=1 Tax=Corynebacterium testudinoris TaxID=136857 RepID=A0A0G3HCY6_9CORY|nr:hypothetical protein [Corynebacterium testudinoris]AKK09037.1 hypothetical protein CTEST_08035 [Corynebacterium testudinoris]MBX8995441.1 hypothetical protein [Corynebacterium testudinoris]